MKGAKAQKFNLIADKFASTIRIKKLYLENIREAGFFNIKGIPKLFLQNYRHTETVSAGA